ncbi:hypothetical protein OF83DRAFT_1191322 [Amylostereum chailletii]|nr:hypothetical protein OF83DRAFT_1191322 [Amylostereum chailletii]
MTCVDQGVGGDGCGGYEQADSHESDDKVDPMARDSALRMAHISQVQMNTKTTLLKIMRLFSPLRLSLVTVVPTAQPDTPYLNERTRLFNEFSLIGSPAPRARKDAVPAKSFSRPPRMPPSLPKLPNQKLSAPAASRAFKMPAFSEPASHRSRARPLSSAPSSSSSASGLQLQSMGPPLESSRPTVPQDSPSQSRAKRTKEAERGTGEDEDDTPHPPSKKQRTSNLSEILRRLEVLEQDEAVSMKTFSSHKAALEKSSREQDP